MPFLIIYYRNSIGSMLEHLLRTFKYETNSLPLISDPNYSIVLHNDTGRYVLSFVTATSMALIAIFVTDLKFVFELMGAVCANLVAWIIPAAL